MDNDKINKIKAYIEKLTLEPDVYNPWVEGFLCGLVYMPEWGITEEEYDLLMVWMQEGTKHPPEKKGGDK